jgi:hypothetical protein
MKRRYLVRGLAESPMFLVTIWAFACSKLASAERLYERKRESGEWDVLQLLDREDVDELTGTPRILKSTRVRNDSPSGTRH